MNTRRSCPVKFGLGPVIALIGSMPISQGLQGATPSEAALGFLKAAWVPSVFWIRLSKTKQIIPTPMTMRLQRWRFFRWRPPSAQRVLDGFVRFARRQEAGFCIVTARLSQ